MISRVVKFITSDKQEFDSEAAAKEHEVQLETIKELADLLRASVNTNRIEAVLKHMLVEQDGVRKILLKFNKRQPKKKKENIFSQVA